MNMLARVSPLRNDQSICRLDKAHFLRGMLDLIVIVIVWARVLLLSLSLY